MTLLLAAESILNAKSRWRQVLNLPAAMSCCIYVEKYMIYLAICSQLRSSAGVLESIIWCFRTRVAPFELDINNPDSRRPEASISTFQSFI